MIFGELNDVRPAPVWMITYIPNAEDVGYVAHGAAFQESREITDYGLIR